MKQIRWARFVVAIFVTLSLAFLPLLSQQAMAGHHATDAADIAALTDGQAHDGSSCAKKSDSQSSDMQMDCCDMNCSNFAAFEVTEVPSVQLQIADHFESDAEQLISHTVFGLMRPPRA